MSGRPGQEFYAQKVQRAREVPQAERCPAVAAFVASEDLLAAVRELLPVQGSEPALAATPANSRQVARAFSLLALAHYLCPTTPVGLQKSYYAYVGFLPELIELLPQLGSGADASTSSSGGSVSDFDITAAILDKFVVATMLVKVGGAELVTAVAEGLRLLQLLGRPALMAAVDRQLAVFEAPHLSAQQLRYAAAHETGKIAAYLLAARQYRSLPRALQRLQAANVQFSSQQTAMLRSAVRAATAALLQLEPGNLKTYTVAAAAAEVFDEPQQAFALNMRGLELARQQRSDYHQAAFGIQLINQASSAAWGAGASRASAEAAVAAFPAVEPALQRCKRLLPLDWTCEVEACLTLAKHAYTAVQQQLQQAAGVHAGALDALAGEQLQRALDAVDIHSLHHCSFCGQQAAGLQLCSQCKQARCCSTECQRQAWRAGHKQECRPAGRG